MGSSTSGVGPEGIGHHVPTSPPLLKWKPYVFAIAIIVGMGGVAVGAVGLAGVLSNRAQVNAIIMMAAGGGGGTILLIMGIVGIVHNQQSSSQQQVDSKRSGATHADSARRTEIIRSIDTEGGLVYGPQAWRIWDVEVLDTVSQRPQIDLKEGDKVLLYIPNSIRVNGTEQLLTLKVLKEISGGPFKRLNEYVERKLGDNIAPGGWVLIDRKVLPDSQGQAYEVQNKRVQDKGCSIPSMLDAVVLNLMVFAFTQERVYGEGTYTHCREIIEGKYPVVVGDFAPDGLDVFFNQLGDNRNCCGIACALWNFPIY